MEILTAEIFFQIINYEEPEFVNFEIDSSLFGESEEQFIDCDSFFGAFSNESIVFKNCKFKIPLDVVWEDEWNNKLLFDGNIFEEKVYFSLATFLAPVNFSSNIFEKDVSIVGCHFKNDACFTKNYFHRNLNFDYARNYVNPSCERKFIFSNSCSGKVEFNRILFNLSDFRDSSMKSDFIFQDCLFNDMAIFRNLNLNDVKFINSDLTNCSFLNSNIKDTSFINCKFNYQELIDEKIFLNTEKSNFFDNDLWDKTESFGKWGKENISSGNLENVINEYKLFEINFDGNKDYEKAGEFHKKRFELERTYSKKSLKKFLLTLYNWSSDYGENYKKSLGWFGIFFLIFTVIYMLFGLIYNGEYRNLEMVINDYSWGKLIEDFNISLLYSFNNAVPLKKDLEYLKSANIYTSFFSILETFIQTILAALFVIGLRRKFKR